MKEIHYFSRKKFLSKLGKGATLALAYPCLMRCTHMEDPKLLEGSESLLGEILILDLTLPENDKLNDPGGYVIVNNEVVIAQTSDGEFIAATRTCSDEDYKKIIWDGKNEEWVCLEHSATFDRTGEGTTHYNDLGRKGLTVYRTRLEENLLTVFIK